MSSNINFGYQQSAKGTDTTGNNLSQLPQGETNVTDLYKEDSVSSDPPLPMDTQVYKGNGLSQPYEQQQLNQIKIFMKKAEKLNEVSYRKLHEGKALVPEASTINIYRSNKNMLDEFNIPSQRDRNIKMIYLKGSKDVKRKTNNSFKSTQRTLSLHRKKPTTDSKWVQTETLNQQNSILPQKHVVQKQNQNHKTLPKKLKNTLKCIQQDDDQQFIPARRRHPNNNTQRMFNTISLTSDNQRKTKANADSYLINVAKAQHEFNKSVKRYSVNKQISQTTVYHNSQQNLTKSSFLQPIVNQSSNNPWQNTAIEEQQTDRNEPLLPTIRQKSSANEQTKRQISVVQPKQIRKQKMSKLEHQTTENSLFVENNNSVKRSRVSEAEFTADLRNTASNHFDSKNSSGFKFPSKNKQAEQVQICVQVPEIRQIAIGTDTNNFVMGSKKPMHPIRINFSQNDVGWITSQYQPKSEFIRNMDTKNFNIKKYRNGVYFGQLSQDGCKNGKGVVFYFNGRSYEGSFHNDVKQGKGFQYMPDGSSYSGQFKNGLKEGKGVFQWPNGEVYDGQWAGGKKNGSGMWKSPKGDSYLGQWMNGKIEGFGVLTVKEGDRYQGQFKNSMKNGLGTERYANGDTYVGQFFKNRPNGQGEYYEHNGNIYKGTFSNGLKHGNGYLKTDTSVYQGQFRNEKKCGYGEETSAQGSIYKGNFQNDLKHGYGEQTCPTHGLTKGYWINGNLVETQMGPIIEDELDRQQSIVNIKAKVKNNQIKEVGGHQRKNSKIKPNKSPKLQRDKSLSPSDPNFERACGCRRKH